MQKLGCAYYSRVVGSESWDVGVLESENVSAASRDGRQASEDGFEPVTAKKSAREAGEKIVEARRYATKDDTKKYI